VTIINVAAPTVAGEIIGEIQGLFARGRHLQAHRSWFRSVSTAHLHVLMMLEVEGSLSMGRLAEALDVSLPSATGLITRMEEHGLVERLRDRPDRRVVRVQLTDAGREITDELEVVRHQHLSRLVEAMTPAEQTTCLRALRIVAETMGRLGIEHDHGAGIGCPVLNTMKETAQR
jgi:DNA-binding MarR family transcriptional regulator